MGDFLLQGVGIVVAAGVSFAWYALLERRGWWGERAKPWKIVVSFLLSLVLLVVGFVLVVKVRCAFGWLPDDEC